MSHNLTFINPDSNIEELGKFVKYIGPFQAKVKSFVSKKTYIIDIDDMWSH